MDLPAEQRQTKKICLHLKVKLKYIF